MNLLKYNMLIISTLAIMTWGCAVDTNDVITAGDKPVIEAYLVPDQPVSMTITQEIPYSINDSVAATPINNLSITVTESGGKTFQLKGAGSGVYKSASNELIKAGKVYNLNFTYNGRPIAATTTVPSKPKSFAEDRTSLIRTQINLAGGFQTGSFQQDDNTPVFLTWENPTNDYYFVVVDNLETTPSPIIILPATTDGSNIAKFIRRFRNQPVQGTSDDIRPQSFQYFGSHRIILFHVNSDYAALYQSNGTTTQNISTPPSTISNGLGLFTGVNADTLKFTVNKR